MECISTRFYYAITSVYFLAYGLLGTVLSNPYVMDINALHMGLGLPLVLYHATDKITESSQLVLGWLMLLFCIIAMRLTSELFKKRSGVTLDVSELMHGLRSEKFYRLPTALVLIAVSLYLGLSYYFMSIEYFTSAIILYNWFCTWQITSPFKPNSPNYEVVFKMFGKVSLASFCTIVALSTLDVCWDRIPWLPFLLGYSLLNIAAPYCLFLQTQYIILMRAINLGREVAILGEFIYVVRYLNRVMGCNI